MQREQNTKQPSRKKKPEKKPALTASRVNRTKYSQRNRKHRKESAEQKSAPRKDQCLSLPHLGAHHQEERQRGAHLAEGEQAALQIGPQSRERSQEEACHGKPAEGAHPAQKSETPLHADIGLPTTPMTTTTTTDHRRSIRHRIAHLQQEGEQTFTQPAHLAPKWSKKEMKTVVITSL